MVAVFQEMCGEDQLLDKLGVILFEYLGEEYPEVLGSILSALKVASHPTHSHAYAHTYINPISDSPPSPL